MIAKRQFHLDAIRMIFTVTGKRETFTEMSVRSMRKEDWIWALLLAVILLAAVDAVLFYNPPERNSAHYADMKILRRSILLQLS